MSKVIFRTLIVTVLFSSCLYATQTITPEAKARQDRIKFACPTVEPTWTCTATGKTECSIDQIMTMLNFGDAAKVVELANQWANKKNETSPEGKPFYPYEYFSHFATGYNTLKTIAGCTPLHYVAVRKCFTGDKSATANAQVEAIKVMMAWGIDSEKNSKRAYGEPFPFNSTCQFAGLHVATAVRGSTVETPASIGYLAAENLNPNVIQAMSDLYNEGKNDANGCTRGSYTGANDKKSYHVFIKEHKMEYVGHVGDAQGLKYAKTNSNAWVSGYDRVCVADFYNSFGNSYNDQRGPSHTSFAQRTGTLTPQWDLDEKDLIGFEKKIQIPHDGTHFIESLGTAIAYGLPIFRNQIKLVETGKKTKGKQFVTNPSNRQYAIDLSEVKIMDKETRFASATLLNILSDSTKINKASDIAVLNKYPDDKYIVIVEKNRKDLYPTDKSIAEVGGVIACTATSCSYISANVKKLMQIELNLDKQDTKTVNDELDLTYASVYPYTGIEKDRM